MWLDEPAPAGATAHAGEERRRLSELLVELGGDLGRERITLGELLAAMDDRAICVLLFILALPNIFPTPPGTSSVLAAPLMLLAAQLAIGLKPWLPPVIAKRSLARADFAALAARVQPWLLRVERLLRPRFAIMAGRSVERLVGLSCFFLGMILVLPIPLGNMPPAFSICVLALGILERDGVWVLAGLASAGASILVAGGVVWGIARAGALIL